MCVEKDKKKTNENSVSKYCLCAVCIFGVFIQFFFLNIYYTGVVVPQVFLYGRGRKIKQIFFLDR